jgi:sulfate adenylyltransferase
MHKCHMQLVMNAIDEVRKQCNGNVCALVHPTVGPTQAGDVHYATRVRCYQAIIPNDFAANSYDVRLAVLPLAMRMAGPREALWHALIRRNYGCTHFVMGRDPAGPSTRARDGSKFYGDYDAHQLVESFTEQELGISIIKSSMLAYVPSVQRYLPLPQAQSDESIISISGTELRNRLRTGQEVPEWFSVPSVVKILRSEMQQQQDGKCCFYFTGLSGAGKSTLARALADRLKESIPAHKINILDGDEVRRNISAGLGFSREDRSRNVRRIGYVASLLVRAGSIVICANIAPYEEDRAHNRALIERYGRYFEIYVDTPLQVCEERDVKGLYQRARAGEIPQFTGISDPFETPTTADLVLDTSKLTLEECLKQLLRLLSG